MKQNSLTIVHILIETTLQLMNRLQDQNSDTSSTTYHLKGLSDRRSSSTATYSPSHMVNLREEIDGDIILPNVGDLIEYRKSPYVVPMMTKSGYKLPPILNSTALKSRTNEDGQVSHNDFSFQEGLNQKEKAPSMNEINNSIDKDICRSMILAREKAFTERASNGNWKTATVKDDIDQIRTHIVGSNGDKVGTIKIAKTPASRLMHLKLSIERLISVDGFDPLFSNDPGALDDDTGLPIQTFDRLEKEVCGNTNLDYFPENVLTDSEQDEDKTVMCLRNIGELSPDEHKFKQINPILQREKKDISDDTQAPLKVSTHILHYRTNMKVVEQLDKIRNMREKSATILRDHEMQRTSILHSENVSLGKIVNPGEYTTVAELITDINSDEQDPLGLIGNDGSLKNGQAISELEAFVMAFDSVLDLLQQKHKEYQNFQGDQRLESVSNLYNQLPCLLNTLERSKDYLVARSVRRTGKVDLLKTQARDMEKRLKVILEENKNLYKELNELRASHDKIKESLANTVANLDSLQYTKAKVERELNSLQDSYEAMKKTRISMEVEMGELALEKDEAFARSKRLTVAAGRLRTIADSAVTRAQNAEKRVILEIKAKQEIEKAYKKASEEVSFLTQKLKRQDVQYKGELQELEREISKLRAIIDDLNAVEDFQAIDTRTVIRSIMESGNASKIMQMAAETVETLSLPETVIHICSSCPEVDQLGLASLIHLLRTLRDPPTIHHFFTIINKEPLIAVAKKAVAIQTVVQTKGNYDGYNSLFVPKNASLKNVYAKQLTQAVPTYAIDYNRPESVDGKGVRNKQELIKEERAAIKNVLTTAIEDNGIDMLGDENVIDTGLIIGNDGSDAPLNILDLVKQTVSVNNSTTKANQPNEQVLSNVVYSGKKEKIRKSSVVKDIRNNDKKKKTSKKHDSSVSITNTKPSSIQKGKDTVKSTATTQNNRQDQDSIASENSHIESNNTTDLSCSISDGSEILLNESNVNKQNDLISQIRETNLELETLCAEDFEKMIAILTDNMENTRIAAQIKMVLSYMLFKSAFCDEFKYCFLDFYNSYEEDFSRPSLTDEEKQNIVFAFVDDFKLRMRIINDEKTEISHLSNMPYNLLDSDHAHTDKHSSNLPSAIDENDNSEAVALDHTVRTQELPQQQQGSLYENAVERKAKLSPTKHRRKIKIIVPMVSRATEHIYADVLTAEDLDCKPDMQLDNCYADEYVMAEEITSDRQSFIADKSCSQPNITEGNDQAAQYATTQQHITKHAYIDVYGKTRLNDTTNAKATRIRNIEKGFAGTVRRKGGVVQDGKVSMEKEDTPGLSVPIPEQIKSIMNRVGPVLKKEDKKLLYKGFKKHSGDVSTQKEIDTTIAAQESLPTSAQQLHCFTTDNYDKQLLKHVSIETVPQAVVDEGLSTITFSDEHPLRISRATSAIITVHADTVQPSTYFSLEEMENFDTAMKQAEIRDFPNGFVLAFHSTKDAIKKNIEKALSSRSATDIKGSASKQMSNSITDTLSSKQGAQPPLRSSSNTDFLVSVRNSSANNKAHYISELEPIEHNSEQIHGDTSSHMKNNTNHIEILDTISTNADDSSTHFKHISDQSISYVDINTQQVDEQSAVTTTANKYVLSYLQDSKGKCIPILIQGTKFYGNLQNCDAEVSFCSPNNTNIITNTVTTEMHPKSEHKIIQLLSSNQEILSSNKIAGQLSSIISDNISSQRISVNRKTTLEKSDDSVQQISSSISWKDQLNELTNLDDELNTINIELQELMDRRSTSPTSPHSRSVKLRSQAKLRTLDLEDCAIQTDIIDNCERSAYNGVAIERMESTVIDTSPEATTKPYTVIRNQPDKQNKDIDLIPDKPLTQWSEILERNPVLYHSSFISGYAFGHYSREDPAMRYNFAKQEEIQLFIQSFSQPIQTDIVSICTADKDMSMSKPLFTPLKTPKIVSVQTDVYSYHIDKLVSAVRLAREVTNPREYLRYDNPRHLRGVDVSLVDINTKSSLPAMQQSHHTVTQSGVSQNTNQLQALHSETTQTTGNYIVPGLIGPKNLPLLPSAQLLQKAQGRKTGNSILTAFADNPLLSMQQDVPADLVDNQPHPDTSGLLAMGGLNPSKYQQTSVVEDFLYLNNQLTSANKVENTADSSPHGRRNLLQVTPLFPFQSDMNLAEQPDRYLNSNINIDVDDQDNTPALTLDSQKQELNSLFRQTSSNRFARIVDKICNDSSRVSLYQQPGATIPEIDTENKKYIQIDQPELLPDNSKHAKLLSAAYLNILAQPESRFISNFSVSPIRPFIIKNKPSNKRFFGVDPYMINPTLISTGISPKEVRTIIQNSTVLFSKQRRPSSQAITSLIGVTDTTYPDSHYKSRNIDMKTPVNVFVTSPESPTSPPKATNLVTRDKKQQSTNNCLVVTSFTKAAPANQKLTSFASPIQLGSIQHPRYGSLTYMQANPLNVAPYCCFLMQTALDKVFAKYIISMGTNQVSHPQIQESSDDKVLKATSTATRQTMCSPCLLSSRVKFHKDLAASSALQKATLIHIDSELKRAQTTDIGSPLVKPLTKQPATLLPNVGEQVSFVRLSAASLHYASERGMIDVSKDVGSSHDLMTSIDSLPIIFKLLEQVTLTPTQIITSLASKQAYIKIPITACYLKSLVWTLKIIRMVLYKRQVATETIIVAKHDENKVEHLAEKNLLNTSVGISAVNDEHITMAYEFMLVPGELCREDAESLPHFLVYWCKSRYGLRSLVSSLLYCIIANVVFYQYENDEVYLFARMLFNDLDNDYFLAYLDLRRSLQLNTYVAESAKELRDASINVLEPIPISAIEPLLNIMFTNWDKARREDLAASIIGSVYDRRSQLVEHHGELTIPFSRIVAIAFYAYSSFRKTLYQALQTILLHFGKEHGCINSVNEAAFRELCSHTIKQWSSEVIAEQFYSFSQVEENYSSNSYMRPEPSAGSVTSVVGKPSVTVPSAQYMNEELSRKQAVQRLMDVDNFIDMFVSNQLGRYLNLSTDVLETSVDSEVKRSIYVTMKLFDRLKSLSEEASKQLICEDIINGTAKRVGIIRKMKDNLTAVASDIACYDNHHALLNVKHAIDTILIGLLDIDTDSVSVALGGAITSLEGYFASQIVDEII